MSLENYPRIFLFWTGDNKMSSNRRKCLESFYSNSFCDVELVDSLNLSSWLVSDLHPAFPYLSFTHRSDYLRCYFMHHHGGGYSDIKFCSFDWRPYFKQLLNSDLDAYMCGYREKSPSAVATSLKTVRSAYRSLPGMGHFIFKSYTPLTSKWITRVHSYLDNVMDSLIENPGTYHPRAVFGGVHGRDLCLRIRHYNSRYPLHWNSLLGRILHPASYEHMNNLILSMPFIDSVTDYR